MEKNILLEKLNENVLMIIEMNKESNSKLKDMVQRVKCMDERIGAIDERIGAIDQHVGGLDARLDTLAEQIETRFDQFEGRLDKLDRRVSKLEQRVSGIELTLENEIRRNIKIIAEGHMDLNRKLDHALELQNRIELDHIRLNVMETDLRKIQEIASPSKIKLHK